MIAPSSDDRWSSLQLFIIFLQLGFAESKLSKPKLLMLILLKRTLLKFKQGKATYARTKSPKQNLNWLNFANIIAAETELSNDMCQTDMSEN